MPSLLVLLVEGASLPADLVLTASSRRSLSVSSVSSVSSGSSSSSSVRSADSDDMYADLASPISSASSQSPIPSQPKKEKASEKNKKDDQRLKEEKRPRDPTATQPPKAAPAKLPKPISGSKIAPPLPAAPQIQSGFSAHKDIKLTLLSKGTDKGSRKRYEPSDKDRLTSPPAKKANISPERAARDRKPVGKPPSPKADRQRLPNPKPSPTQPDRKRPASPPQKGSSKVTSVPGKALEAAPSAPAAKTGKASTLSRREELLKQLKAVEDAIARKRAKIPGKV
ncbi:hypothetical protein GDO78_021418 [Eleutherodactylus coqui]|uniref:Zinc finger CCCH domain-containing protein 18 n=1 Tax=Eleutherodactylus coqui TaxID=57060 RepID=A0A8J6BEP2_ELECQ|nr:hypothetical protein GDO78_021418 [Eleutherodactylus coqui]